MASVVSSIRVAGLWNFRVAVASTRQRIKRLGNVCSALKTISDLTGFALLQLGSAMNVVHPAQSSIDGAARRDGRIFGSGRCAGGMAGRGSKIWCKMSDTSCCSEPYPYTFWLARISPDLTGSKCLATNHLAGPKVDSRPIHDRIRAGDSVRARAVWRRDGLLRS